MPNLLCPRDLVSIPDKMDKIVLHQIRTVDPRSVPVFQQTGVSCTEQLTKSHTTCPYFLLIKDRVEIYIPVLGSGKQTREISSASERSAELTIDGEI